MSGLSSPVQIVRDRWGVAHITAHSTQDLFFAQGFVQAEDRLFQMDLWRRSVQGRLAEVLGSNFVGRDAMTRRIQYRGDPEEDWAALGAETQAIAKAFVEGINAWVQTVREHPPEEFALAGWRPELWRPEDLLNRTDAFLASGDAMAEVFRSRLASAVGPARAASLLDLQWSVPPGVKLGDTTFQVSDTLRQVGAAPFFAGLTTPSRTGSNAWAIAARRTAGGAPILATDPHRLLTTPSARYLVHLIAPGWNVIGATAPWLPGVTLGHNDQVAWGMTAFDADTEDLYVERLNPENSHQVDIDGQWANTRVVQDTIWVKGGKTVIFEREYTPHGVVVAVDGAKHLAFVLRWSGFEPGAAGELAALALDRATSAGELREALTHWKMPAVEVVFAGRDAIGAQVAALVPRRRALDGHLPSAGWQSGVTWDGWRSLDELPHASASTTGEVVSANRSRARTERLRELLAGRSTFTVNDTLALQQDVHAWNADRLVPLLARLRSPRPEVDRARQGLLDWDREVSIDSRQAALYVTWEQALRRLLIAGRVPPDFVQEFSDRFADVLVPALVGPTRTWFDGDVVRARDALLLAALAAAVDDLAVRTGASDAGDTWGRLHTTMFVHPLAVTAAARRRFAVGPLPRGGYAETVMSTSGAGLAATVGAAFSAVFDLSDWDRSVAQNPPGQSESPASAHFSDLSRLWSEGRSFPLTFGESAIRANTEWTLTLVPRGN